MRLFEIEVLVCLLETVSLLKWNVTYLPTSHETLE